MIDDEEKATCRGCGRELIGNPFYMGGNAYIPGPKMERARKNYYGGFVCSRACDFRSSLRLEQTMPGQDANQQTLGSFARERLNRNWPENN